MNTFFLLLTLRSYFWLKHNSGAPEIQLPLMISEAKERRVIMCDAPWDSKSQISSSTIQSDDDDWEPIFCQKIPHSLIFG